MFKKMLLSAVAATMFMTSALADTPEFKFKTVAYGKLTYAEEVLKTRCKSFPHSKSIVQTAMPIADKVEMQYPMSFWNTVNESVIPSLKKQYANATCNKIVDLINVTTIEVLEYTHTTGDDIDVNEAE